MADPNQQAAAPPAAAPAAPAAAPAAQKDDYLDKAFDMGAKKSGHKIDAGTREKITDGIRGFFEKVTGKKVSSKISN